MSQCADTREGWKEGNMHKQDMDPLEWVQRITAKIMGGWSIFPMRTG